MARSPLLLVLLLPLAACGGRGGGGPSSGVEAAERVWRDGDAPTPFTAAEIRAGCPDGREVRYRVEGPDGVMIQVFRFRDPDEEGVTFELEARGEDGTPRMPPRSQRASWRELQGHASFPAERTEVREEAVTTPAGTFPGVLYVVRGTDDEGHPTLERYHFARTLPGPPARIQREQDGQVVFTMTLVQDHTPPAGG